MADNHDEPLHALVELNDSPPRPVRRNICSSNKHRVVFHHPAYKSTRLLEISAFDETNGGTHHGIHHGTALLLCGIIAGGAWHGWLSESVAGPRLTASPEAVLTKSDYYYHLPYPTDVLPSPSAPYKWPAVLSLDDLPFPHGRPPPGWTFGGPDTALSFYSNASVSSMSQAVRDRDVTCRVTDWADGTERAHLCARKALDWFTREELERYNTRTNLSGATSVDDMANAITLRQDVHTALDKGDFIFVRKHARWVPHFLNPTRNLGPEYHNVPIEMPAVVNEAFILANIAIAILPLVHNFLVRGEKRVVMVQRENNTPQIVELTGAAARDLLDRNKRQRSKSPRKRTRDPDQNHELYDAPDQKRQCTREWASKGHENVPTPALTVSAAPSNDPSIPDELDPGSLGGQAEWLRGQALKEQRHLNKEVACCDYNAAEYAISHGIDGPAEFGGAHVCPSCLGLDVIDAVATT